MSTRKIFAVTNRILVGITDNPSRQGFLTGDALSAGCVQQALKSLLRHQCILPDLPGELWS